MAVVELVEHAVDHHVELSLVARGHRPRIIYVVDPVPVVATHGAVPIALRHQSPGLFEYAFVVRSG